MVKKMPKTKTYIANRLIFSPVTRKLYEKVMIPAVKKYVKIVNKPGSFPGLKDDMTDEGKSKAIFDYNVEKL
jgi:hypothetical protein